MRMCTCLLIALALGLLLTACYKQPPPTLSEAQRVRARQLAIYSVAWHQEHPISAGTSDRKVRIASAENSQLVDGFTTSAPDDAEEGVTCHR